MNKREKKSAALSSKEDPERADRLMEVLRALFEVNIAIPVIVEGRRDANALQSLGFVGKVIVLHSGKRLYEFCEEIAEHYPRVVLLFDWDAKGEELFRAVASNLSGHWEEFSVLREAIKAICQKDIKDIEGIPKLLGRLAGVPPEKIQAGDHAW